MKLSKLRYNHFHYPYESDYLQLEVASHKMSLVSPCENQSVNQSGGYMPHLGCPAVSVYTNVLGISSDMNI